jgi:hypothetical protein
MTERETPAAQPSLSSITPSASSHRGRWVVLLLLAAFCLMGWASWKVARALGAFAWGFQPPAMAAAQHSPTDVIGDLGGMPVKISRHVAEYVEYEGDPGWSGPRKGPPPVRTYASRLVSFGFRVRFPDMAMLLTEEMWADRRSYNIYNTPWMTVGVTTGPHYPGREFMNRPALSKGKLKGSYWWNTYEEIKPGPFGLIEYRVSGTDPRTGKLARYAADADVIYLYRDRAGNVKTRIVCINVPHEAAPCTQTWDMGENGVSAELSAMYRHGLMEHWRAIQQQVTKVVLTFRVDPKGELQASQPVVDFSAGEPK